jgi:hypothetical protein
MTKPPEMPVDANVASARRVGAPAGALAAAPGVVHCFVDGEELRRMLANMAAAELVSLIVQAALG